MMFIVIVHVIALSQTLPLTCKKCKGRRVLLSLTYNTAVLEPHFS